MSSKYLEMVKSIAYIAVLVIIIRGCIFELYKIPSGSMKETLLTDDIILVSKFSYGIGPYSAIVPLPIDKRIFFSKPKRGDIIVFKSPHENDPKDKYIKRLIGLPGDKIQVIDRVIHINGEAIKLTKDGQFFDKDLNKTYDRFLEENPEGVKYHVLYNPELSPSDFPSTTPIYEIPTGYYFFMGDNRDNSTDSRFLQNIGYIHETRLLGKTQFIMWNGSIFTNILNLFRGERTLLDVRALDNPN
jgi:signal peptidase I